MKEKFLSKPEGKTTLKDKLVIKSMNWIQQAQHRLQWQAVVVIIVNLRVLHQWTDSCTTPRTVNITRWTFFCCLYEQ
jgi:hypothetical protein